MDSDLPDDFFDPLPLTAFELVSDTEPDFTRTHMLEPLGALADDIPALHADDDEDVAGTHTAEALFAFLTLTALAQSFESSAGIPIPRRKA